MFKLTFLGTSAGLPTKHRNVTALAVECINTYQTTAKQKSKSNRPWVLIDCGEATQHQILKTNLSVHQLKTICITHVHGDHCYGLPGLLASMAMVGRKEDLLIIAPKSIRTFIESVKQTTDLRFPFAIRFIAIEDLISDASEDANGNTSTDIKLTFSNPHSLFIKITALSHRVPSYAFDLTQTLSTFKLDTSKLEESGIEASPVWGLLQQGQDVMLDNGAILKSEDYTQRQSQKIKIVVAGDNDQPELLRKTIQDATVLVHEATYTQAVADKILSRTDEFDPMHTTAKSIACFAQSAQLPALILTHFSARYQPFDNPSAKIGNMADIRIEAEKYYDGHLWLARDFAQFEADESSVTELNVVTKVDNAR